MLGAAGTASAADVQFDPYVEVGGQYTDNFTLDRLRPLINEVSGAFAQVGAQLRAESPRSRWILEPRVRRTEFPDDPALESTDYFFTASGEVVNPRSAYGITADLFDQFIVQSQLPGTDFGDASLGQGTGSDSGRFVGDDRQTSVSLRPFAQFDLTELTRLRVEGSISDVSFDQNVLGFQVSFQSVGGALRLERRFSQASTLGLVADWEHVEPEIGIGDSDLYSLQLQWDYRLAERVSAYGRAGMRRSDFEVAGPTPRGTRVNSEDTPLLGAGVRWNFQRSDLFVDMQRVVSANSSGFVVERDELRLFYNHRFSTRLRGYLGFYGIRDESVTEIGIFVPREYVTGSVGLEWRFKQAWALAGELSNARQKFQGDPDFADGTAFRASVLYRPRRRD